MIVILCAWLSGFFGWLNRFFGWLSESLDPEQASAAGNLPAWDIPWSVAPGNLANNPANKRQKTFAPLFVIGE